MAPLWCKDRSLGRVPVRPHTILHAFTQQTDSSQLTPGWEVLTETEVQASRVNKQFRMVNILKNLIRSYLDSRGDSK